jgi:flagellar biosynthesis/type III secretory pathway M-ring protein FliF/YscJ
MLAHGGTAGAVAEAAFILIPMVVFAWLARVSRKRREAAEAEEADQCGEAEEADQRGEAGEGDVDESTVP